MLKTNHILNNVQIDRIIEGQIQQKIFTEELMNIDTSIFKNVEPIISINISIDLINVVEGIFGIIS